MPTNLRRARAPLALAFLIAVSGCDRKPAAPAHDHAHEPEEKSTSHTVFSERHEIFAEHRLLVVNVATNFATHVTDLVSLEPKRQGPLTYVLTQGADAPIEKTETTPERDGIYGVKLTFPKAGKWKVVIKIPVEKGEDLIELPPLEVYATKEDVAKAPEEEAPEGISFLKEQQWRVLSGTSLAKKRTLTERLALPAHVEPRPGSRAEVTPPLAGRLIAPTGRSFPTVGERVEEGQLLAYVQPPLNELAVKLAEAETGVTRTKLAAEQAEKVAARVRRLATEEAKSPRELEEAEFNLASAKAAYEAAQVVQGAWQKAGTVFVKTGNASLPAVELRAPISGVVTEVLATIGAHVSADKALLTLLDTTSVFLEAHVAEADLARLGTGTIVASYENPLEPGSASSPIVAPDGRLVLRGLEVEHATRTLPLVFEVANAKQLPTGLATTVFVATAHVEEAVAIPESAIVEEDGRPIVFVEVSGETFAKRQVTLGLRDGGFVQVVDGVKEGERVVSKEAYAIRLASVSNVIPAHGHAH